jgi:hypothetical protein
MLEEVTGVFFFNIFWVVASLSVCMIVMGRYFQVSSMD